MNSLSFTIGFNIGLDDLFGGKAPKQVVCICLDCYHRVDPANEYPVRHVPSSIAGECAWCTEYDPRDLRFVTVPREVLVSPHDPPAEKGK